MADKNEHKTNFTNEFRVVVVCMVLEKQNNEPVYITATKEKNGSEKKHTISMPERIIVFGGYWQGPIDQTMYIRACQM